MVKSVLAANILDQILKSMGFESDKALRYDPKGIINQRRMDAGFRGYDAEQDEVLAALANSDILEPVNSEDGSSRADEKSSRSASNWPTWHAYSISIGESFEEAS